MDVSSFQDPRPGSGGAPDEAVLTSDAQNDAGKDHEMGINAKAKICDVS
jgi:hypothetical protein